MFKIKIFEGTDTIKIGMTSQEISGIVGEMPEKTPKGEGERLADMYDFGFICYDKSGKCEAIEFFDTAQVEWNGGDLMKKSTKEVMAMLKELDSDLDIEDEDIFSSLKYSIGIYGEEGKVKSVYVGRERIYLEQKEFKYLYHSKKKVSGKAQRLATYKYF